MTRVDAQAGKVLMVTREHGSDKRYGLGRSVWPLAEALATRGWTVRYLCQEDLSSAQRHSRQVWVQRLGRLVGSGRYPHRQWLVTAWAERLQMGWYAARTAREGGYTHVHLHDPWMGLGFSWGLRRWPQPRVRWGITEHGFGCYSQATHDDGLVQGPRTMRWLRRVEAHVLAQADWVVCPTEAARHQLTRDLGLPHPPAHWQCIPHARPEILDLPQQQARKRLGWDKNGLYVLGVGRLVPLKRFDDLLAACIALSQRWPQLRLCLLGGGDATALRTMAETHQFADRLLVAETDEVAPYYRAADVYVSTSSTESFGLANLEALCTGLPSICTAVGGVPEVVGDGGWLVPTDRLVVQQALQTLVEDPALRIFWAERAMRRAAQWPSLDEVTQRYVELYTTAPAG